MNKDLKIGIIGLGLIGGSIFKALCNLKYNVFATTRSLETIAKARKYSKNVSNSITNLKDCNIVFVCTPMNKVLQTLDDLETIVSKDCVVCDVSSLKEFVTKKERPYKLVPTHPMAGTEFNGFEHSFEELFEDAKWVVTPINNEDISLITDLIKEMKAFPIICKAKEHDMSAAMISHMPMLVAQGLFASASSNKLALKLASSGFRDMTRLALSNEELANDMITMNDKNIQEALLILYSSIGELLKGNYKEKITEMKPIRANMYNKNGKNAL